MSKTWSVTLVCTLVLATMLSACGKSGNSSGTTVTPSPPDGGDAPGAVEGIEMPSSVSVVTATNAS